MTIFYLDHLNGNDANDGSSWAQAWKTITSGATAARIAPGDTIRVAKSPDPTSLGSCTWTNNSRDVTIPAGVVKNVDMCESGWVGSTNVTRSEVTTRRKQGTYMTQLAIASGFTTGKVAYKALSGAEDFSSYRQINLWLCSDTAFASGVFQVCLCSDAAGDTPVDTFAVPAHVGFNYYCPVVADKGSALGASIQSVAIYAVSDPGTVTIAVDDIFASKAPSAADCLTLRSVISKGGLGFDACYHGISSVDGTTIKLGCDISKAWDNADQKTYPGATESVTTYVRQTIYVEFGDTVQDSGTSGSPITFSGGWNTGSTTRDGITFLWQFKNATPLALNGKSFISFEHWGFTGYGNNGVVYADTQIASVTLDDIWACHGPVGLIYYANSSRARSCSITNVYIGLYGSLRLYVYGTNSQTVWAVGLLIENVYMDGGYAGALSFTGVARSRGVNIQARKLTGACTLVACTGQLEFVDCSFDTCGTYAFTLTTQTRGVRFYNLTTTGHTSGGIYSQEASECTLFGCSIAETNEVVFDSDHYADVQIRSIKHDGVADSHKVFQQGGTIVTGTAVRHTASGISWQMSPTNEARTSLWPLSMKLAVIGVAADKLVTVNVYVRRTNTGLNARLRVPGGQIAGVDDDVSDTASGDADTWEQLELTFTPTEAGVVEAYIETWGGTTYSVYVDDFDAAQAA